MTCTSLPPKRRVFAYAATAPPIVVLGSRAELKQISQVAHKKTRAILSYLSPNVVSFMAGCFHPLIKAKTRSVMGMRKHSGIVYRAHLAVMGE